jgi:hypothetical protein
MVPATVPAFRVTETIGVVLVQVMVIVVVAVKADPESGS